MGTHVALVTGAARGIGEATARRLAHDGFAVVVTDIADEAAKETAEQITTDGGRACALPLDVTDAASVEHAVNEAVATFGSIDVLVNNAGWDEAMPFIETSEDFWLRVVDINYLGAVRLTKAVLAGMIEREWGRIVNVGSDAARVGSSMEAVYAGAKGGVIAFTKTIAREVATKGITANVVCPGPTLTPLVRTNIEESPDSVKLLGKLERAIPMRRLGEPEDIAAAISFFAREDAGYITGQTLSVSGGLTMA